MTTTDKPVRRVTRDKYNVLFSSAKNARRIVVEIATGDLLVFREQGRRERWALPIESGFRFAVRLQVFLAAAEDVRARKARGLKPRGRKAKKKAR